MICRSAAHNMYNLKYKRGKLVKELNQKSCRKLTLPALIPDEEKKLT